MNNINQYSQLLNIKEEDISKSNDSNLKMMVSMIISYLKNHEYSINSLSKDIINI